MNRDIRFRGWDRENNEMIYSDHEGGLQQFFDYTDNPTDFTTNDVEFMQFTGLNDKNGKEIYEGDILQAFYGKKNTLFTITKVYFNEKGYWDSKNISEKAPFKVCYLGFCKCELIGNIYENPELLKEDE